MTSRFETIREALEFASQELRSARIENPRHEATILVSHALGLSTAQVYGRWSNNLSRKEAEKLTALVGRRAENEPMAYLLEAQEFWSLPFHVDSSVLVPRPETECLVEACLKDMPMGERLDVLEIGVGSGAIVAALATERPDYTFTATDISPRALATALRNLVALGLGERVTLVEGDLFGPISERTFDWIVSNPPYVSTLEYPGLMVDVRDYEPKTALVAGEDGLDVIRRIGSESSSLLRDHGKLAIEHGAAQQDEVVRIFQSFGFEVSVRGNDYAGRPRFVIAEPR